MSNQPEASTSARPIELCATKTEGLLLSHGVFPTAVLNKVRMYRAVKPRTRFRHVASWSAGLPPFEVNDGIEKMISAPKTARFARNNKGKLATLINPGHT